MLIGATMLYNAYIISQGKQCVSTLRSHRYYVRGGGRQDLWTLVSGPTWLLLLILGIGGGTGEQGPTPHQLSAAEKGVGWAAFFNFLCSSPHCPRNCLLEWMPFLCFEASFLFLGPTDVADGCGEMTTRMLHWKNTWYIGLDKEGDISSAFGVLSRSG